jgi:hypothetical protein
VSLFEHSATVVCGSRDWPSDKLWFVTAVMIEHGRTKVIAGGARGVDKHAIVEARRLRWPWHEEKANWEVTEDTPPERIRRRRDGTLYDCLAGFERNLRMLDMEPDRVLAFQWAGSSGTQHTIENARERGIKTYVYTERDMRPDIAALDTDYEPIGGLF